MRSAKASERTGAPFARPAQRLSKKTCASSWTKTLSAAPCVRRRLSSMRPPRACPKSAGIAAGSASEADSAGRSTRTPSRPSHEGQDSCARDSHRSASAAEISGANRISLAWAVRQRINAHAARSRLRVKRLIVEVLEARHARGEIARVLRAKDVARLVRPVHPVPLERERPADAVAPNVARRVESGMETQVAGSAIVDLVLFHDGEPGRDLVRERVVRGAPPWEGPGAGLKRPLHVHEVVDGHAALER